MKYFLSRACLVAVFLLVNLSCFGQYYDFDSLYKSAPHFKDAIDNMKDTFDIFNYDDIMEVTITSDFRNLIKKKYEDIYQPAVLETVMFDTVLLNREIKIRPRGEFRRKNCYFPPFKMNFPKKQAVFSQFGEFDKVKFVGNCKSGDLYDVYVLLEYYTYKMYNLLSPYSYRVRLLKVKYIDTSGKKKPRDNYAFVIESTDQLAKRLGGINIERKGISNKMVDRNTSTVMGLFQLMVGNTDYAIPVLHNIKLFKLVDIKYPMPIVVPYDFDYSGIVNAFYAIPGEHLPIENVRQRYYMGACREMTEYEEAFKVFREKREVIESLFKNSEYLTENAKKAPLNYIDEFYKIIDNKGAVKSIILAYCR
jgi:hypothetical protein